MAKVHEIVRTHAILTYLASRPAGCASLGELSQHFHTPWKTVLKLLWDANLIEIPGMVAPFDLVLPDLPEQWDGEGEEPSPDSLVWLGAASSGEIPPLNLTLEEAMVLLALLDNVVEVTPPGESREALLRLRSEITESATRAGFGQALWREPESPIAATPSRRSFAVSTNGELCALPITAPDRSYARRCRTSSSFLYLSQPERHPS